MAWCRPILAINNTGQIYDLFASRAGCENLVSVLGQCWLLFSSTAEYEASLVILRSRARNLTGGTESMRAAALAEKAPALLLLGLPAVESSRRAAGAGAALSTSIYTPGHLMTKARRRSCDLDDDNDCDDDDDDDQGDDVGDGKSDLAILHRGAASFTPCPCPPS